jgi:DNA polymerase elongation subunit (family B)
MSKTQITDQVISDFLEGRDPQKYITNVEVSYSHPEASVIVNDPVEGKYMQNITFKPFIWMKAEAGAILYDGNRAKIKQKSKQYGIKFKTLRSTNENGFEPDRLKDGYKYLVTCDNAYGTLLRFFTEGGVDVYSEKQRHLFMTISPVEQFLIQTGKRLFKGFEDYKDLHKFNFDLETEGLDPKTQPIFQIGMRDNRGFEEIIEVEGNTPEERAASEKQAIINFFKIIDHLKPDVINGYNSENFDWNYFDMRCQVLGMKLADVAITLSDKHNLSRKDSTIKLGGTSEHYQQTYMWGYSILDIYHAVRKAQAINSEIKAASLKYITKFSKVAKANRVYVAGDILNKTWADKENDYYLNDEDGEWFKYQDPNKGDVGPNLILTQQEKLDSGKFTKVTGAYIVQRYLLDDLWETDMVDDIYNQATFLVAKILPTTFMRTATMGTASTWKLIMMAWSYEQGLALPSLEDKRDFTGGLARLTEVGFAKRVAKLDYAALYPNIELTHDIFPDLDISGVMKGMLFYIVNQRDIYKFKKGDHSDECTRIKKLLEKDPDNKELQKEFKEHDYLKSLYDKKQLPLKILANSFFGSFGAPYLFNWGDSNCAEETTCRGRQYLRLMVRHFWEKYGFRPLVGDTDGFNFAIPDSVDEISYFVNGTHRLTEKHKGKTLTGLDAVVADFNEEYMIGRMGLDIDDVCNSTINFSRKNYANDIGGKIKLVGNTIKSKKLPTYIEEFLNQGIRMLLDDNGKDFIELYYKKVDEIFNYQVPLAKIATKAKVNETIDQYKLYCKKKNKAGNLMSRKAYMELIMEHDLKMDLGDVLYYVNTGTAKSHPDLKAIKDDNGNITHVELNCKLISAEQMEKNPDLTTDEYNVAKYLAAFNKRIKPLLVCFDDEVRKNLIIDTKTDRKTKELVLKPRKYFTDEQCKLVSGKPLKDGDQDTYEDLMTLDDKEIRFWTSVNKVPNNMEESEWREIEADYHKRMKQQEVDGIADEKEKLVAILKKMKPQEFDDITEHRVVRPEILQYGNLVAVTDENDDICGFDFSSKKYHKTIMTLSEMLSFKPEAVAREEYFATLYKKTEEQKFELWENHKAYKEFKEGTVSEYLTDEVSEDQKELDTIAEEEEVSEEQEKLLWREKRDIIYSYATVETDGLADMEQSGIDIVQWAEQNNYIAMKKKEMEIEDGMDTDELMWNEHCGEMNNIETQEEWDGFNIKKILESKDDEDDEWNF